MLFVYMGFNVYIMIIRGMHPSMPWIQTSHRQCVVQVPTEHLHQWQPLVRHF